MVPMGMMVAERLRTLRTVADRPRALLVGGDAPTQSVVHFLLTTDRYGVAVAADPAAPLPARMAPALCVVMASFDAPDPLPPLASLHRAGYRGPLVLLARSPDNTLRRRAFALGARDVVGLPTTPAVLRARLRVLAPPCRQGAVVATGDTETGAPTAPRAGGLTLDLATGRVDDGQGWTVRLTRYEAGVLAALMRAPGRPQSRHDLLDQVWGTEYEGDGDTLEVLVRRLRAKLARPAVPRGYVHTARGQGYAFEARRAARSVAHTPLPTPVADPTP